MTGILKEKEKKHRDRYSGEGHVKVEAEVEGMNLQVKGHQGLQATTKSWHKSMEQILPRAFSVGTNLVDALI